jgi:hypothetical protein
MTKSTKPKPYGLKFNILKILIKFIFTLYIQVHKFKKKKYEPPQNSSYQKHDTKTSHKMKTHKHNKLHSMTNSHGSDQMTKCLSHIPTLKTQERCTN